MKAIRRVTSNAALVECVQVAAEKARWPISAEAKAQSSLRGGGTPERAAIPATPIDDRGMIGRPETRSAAAKGTLPAGTTRIPLSKQPIIEGARDGRAAPAQVPQYQPQRMEPAGQQQPAPQPQAAGPAVTPPPASAPAQQSSHGAMRFSSVFGTRRR
jgi:hypothetical protein